MKKLLKTFLFGLGISLSACGVSDVQHSATTSKQQASSAKIAAFNDVPQLQNTLSKNGIGDMRKWRGDEAGFISSSDYFSFGASSAENSLQNNLAYYLESEKEQSVQQLKLMLNINNKAEKEKALTKYSEVIEKTFKNIGLELPKGLLEACKTGKAFKNENDAFSVISELRKSKIDSWKLTIQTK